MMSNELRTVRSNWTRLEGATLDGGFLLKQMIGADDVSATFRTADREVVKTYRLSGDAAEEQLHLWKQARKLQHPNLIQVLGSGRTELEGEQAIFVALESTDESLDAALRDRSLDRDESSAIAFSVADALGYLHSQGFVHGYLSPETVYAVGETVRLSPEGMRAIGSPADSPLASAELHRPKYPAPESDAAVSPAMDVWSLGATLYEALTQKDARERQENEHVAVPAPFETIVNRALDPVPNTRIALPELQELVSRGPEVIAESPAPLPEIVPAATSISIPVGLPIDEREPAPVPSETAGIRETRKADSRGLSKLIYGLIAVVVVAGLILVLRARNTGQRQQQAAVAQQQKQSALPSEAKPPEPITQQTKPSAMAPAPATRRALPPVIAAAPSRAAGGNNIWRVIVYTYNGAAEAQRKVASINAKHPEVQAAVFSPKEGSSPYLVVIGGGMTREQAIRLRQKAVRLGLPRDSYMQNYSR